MQGRSLFFDLKIQAIENVNLVHPRARGLKMGGMGTGLPNTYLPQRLKSAFF